MFIISSLVATSLVATDIRIEQVLPNNAIAVMAVDDVSQMVNHFEQIGVCEMICDIAQEAMSAKEISLNQTCPITSTCKEIQEELGIDGELVIPNGYAGMGLYPVVDYETESVGLGAFIMLEVGDSKVGEMMSKAVDKHAAALEVEVETVDIGGRDVWMIQNDLDFFSEQGSMPFDISSLSQMYFTFADGYILLGTEPDVFSSIFSEMDGESVDSSLSDNEDYIALMERCGDSGDLHASVLLTNLADTLMQLDSSGMGMLMVLPMLKSAIGDIDGLAETVSFSPSDDILLSGKYAILMSEGRNGLMALVGSEVPRAQIPKFVGEDTVSYAQVQINYDKITTWFKEMVEGNPMLSMQMNPQIMEQIESMISMYTIPLGKETHIISSGNLPYTAETIGYLVAVECVDEEQLSNVLGLMMPSMGAVPADFLGNQIFTIDLEPSMTMPVEMSFSIAVGGGYALFGTSNSVENALRTIANPKSSKKEHGVNAATALLSSSDVSSWGYGDVAKSFEIQTAVRKDLNDSMFAQIEEFDPEMAAELKAEASSGFAIQDSIVESLSLIIGPMSWSMSTDDSGFTAEVIMLKPDGE